MGIRELTTILPFRAGKADDIFICSASFEERCIGVHRLFDNYIYQRGFVFADQRGGTTAKKHLRKIAEASKSAGPLELIEYSESDPTNSLVVFEQELLGLGLDPKAAVITIDISTFNKRHLLMLLKQLDDHGYWESLRIIYTEPQDYVTDLYLPMSSGIRQINPVPGFVNTQPLNKPILLIVMLGYEGDRAIALFNNLDPNETILIVPKPAFHSEWEGRTESMNRDLLILLGDDNVRFADSRDSAKVVSQISKMLENESMYNLEDWGCCFTPLGTKPQVLGLYLFWRMHPNKFSILYAQPLKHNELFNSTGIGRTWLLLSPVEC
jgi:hypothetical protein